jgi:hypothetical protein
LESITALAETGRGAAKKVQLAEHRCSALSMKFAEKGFFSCCWAMPACGGSFCSSRTLRIGSSKISNLDGFGKAAAAMSSSFFPEKPAGSPCPIGN